MPTHERRAHLTFLISDNKRKEEAIEEQQEEIKNNSATKKGQTRVSGDQLKAKLKNGEIPYQ